MFTFGSGRHGQLGHNSLRNELRPRLVAELWGAKVTQIACGRYVVTRLIDRSHVNLCTIIHIQTKINGCSLDGKINLGVTLGVFLDISILRDHS